MSNNKKNTVIDDMATLRAFVLPDNYPFLLEVYIKDDKDQETLDMDIQKARDKYKELSMALKKKTPISITT